MNHKAFRTKSQNRSSMLLVGFVVALLLVVVCFNETSLRSKQDAYQQRITELNEQIVQQEQRSQQLEALKKYTKTDAYVEEVAKDKLGLVHPGEIVFKIKR